MLAIEYTNAFKSDIRKIVRRGYDFTNLLDVVVMLAKNERPFPPKYRDHALQGEWAKFRELHIEPDWLLAYYVEDNTCFLARTGTHSELFGK